MPDAARVAEFITELPLDRERSTAGQARVASIALTLSPESGLHALAEAEGVPLALLYAVAWSVVLARHSFARDVVIGMRSRASDPLRPLCVAIAGAASFRDLVRDARADAGEHAATFRTAVVVGAPPTDLDVVVAVDESGALALHYDASVLDEETIVGIGRSFVTSLAAFVRAPDRAARDAPLLDADGTRAILALSSGPPLDEPFERIDALVGKAAAADPDVVAIRHRDRSVTYRELVERANALAHWLRRRVPAKGTTVGLLYDWSPEFAVAQLGIWTAGHACVPMDAGVPLARAKRMLDESGAALVLCAPHLVAELDGVGCERVTLDSIATELAREPTTPPPRESAPQDLAYVIFTSGSTGVPKGVALHHAGLTNHLRTNALHFGSGRGETWIHLFPLAFDVSLQTIWTPLVRGSTLVFVPKELLVSPKDFVKWLAAEGVTNCALPSSLFEALVDEDWSATKVKHVGTGIEKLHKLERKLPFYLTHGYGTTETSIGVARMKPVTTLPPPIGRPFPNSRMYLLDESFTLLPRGALGECFIGGVQVGRGYLRADTTAERFLPDPFGPPGSRMYRTGDVMRWRSDGMLEFRGRADRQIKSRGFRIEPGEIESALRNEPEVSEALVVAFGEQGRSDRIVAYVVPSSATTSAAIGAALLPRLKAKLPEYMVPSAIVALERFPLNSNGKIDRKALPPPELDRDEHASAPAGDLEIAIAEAWRTVLRIERVGRDDNFFDLGGHSMLVVRLVALLRARLGVEIPGGLLFEAPTIAQLAKRVAQLDGGATRPPVERAEDRARAPLSWNQLSFWRRQERRPRSPSLCTVEVYRARGALDAVKLARAFDEVFARHDALRTRFQIVDGAPIQTFADPTAGVLERVDAPSLDDAHAFLRARHDEPTEMLGAPLVRAFLLRRAPDEHWIAIKAHRAVLDPMLCGPLLQEILSVYDARGVTREDVQYADFVAWQRRVVDTPDARARIERTRARLAGAPPMELPYDRSSPGSPTNDVHAQRVAIHEATWRAVRDLARVESTAPFVVLAALYNAYLAALTGQNDLTVIAPNELMRELDPRLLGVLGCFHDYFVLRTEIDPTMTVRQLVRRQHAIVIEAQRNVDIPCALVTDEYLDGPRWRAVLNVMPNVEATRMASSLEFTHLGYPAGKRHRMIDLAWGVFGEVAHLIGTADKFHASTVERMAARLARVVERAVAGPDAKLEEATRSDD